MADSQDDNAANSEKAEAETAQSRGINLPMVVSPKLGTGEDEAIDESPEIADATAAAAAPAHSTRFLMLAATVAFAAAFGSFVGSVSGSGMARYLYPAAPASGVENTSEAMREMKLDLAELATLKASLDTAARSTTSQFTKLADRLDRLDQHASGSSTSPETTGSIANATPPAPAPTSSDAPKLADRILEDWIIQDVQNGRALVESRYGGLFDVGAGSVLPGVGRVDAVKRQDGRWIVLTARGTITSGR